MYRTKCFGDFSKQLCGFEIHYFYSSDDDVVSESVDLQSDSFESRSDFSRDNFSVSLDKQGIRNICSYSTKKYASVVLTDSEVTLLG